MVDVLASRFGRILLWRHRPCDGAAQPIPGPLTLFASVLLVRPPVIPEFRVLQCPPDGEKEPVAKAILFHRPEFALSRLQVPQGEVQ